MCVCVCGGGGVHVLIVESLWATLAFLGETDQTLTLRSSCSYMFL